LVERLQGKRFLNTLIRFGLKWFHSKDWIVFDIFAFGKGLLLVIRIDYRYYQ
jgi:hypothetical protein